jgi:hypothetical protein
MSKKHIKTNKHRNLSLTRRKNPKLNTAKHQKNPGKSETTTMAFSLKTNQATRALLKKIKKII